MTQYFFKAKLKMYKNREGLRVFNKFQVLLLYSGYGLENCTQDRVKSNELKIVVMNIV